MTARPDRELIRIVPKGSVFVARFRLAHGRLDFVRKNGEVEIYTSHDDAMAGARQAMEKARAARVEGNLKAAMLRRKKRAG